MRRRCYASISVCRSESGSGAAKISPAAEKKRQHRLGDFYDGWRENEEGCRRGMAAGW